MAIGSILISFLMSIGFGVLLNRLGWGKELDDALEIGKLEGSTLGRKASRFWFDKLLPSIQATRWFSIAAIAIAAIGVCLLDVSWFFRGLDVVFAIGISAALFFAGKPMKVTRGTASIAINSKTVDIPFGVSFKGTPVLIVDAVSPLDEPKITHVRSNGCTVEIEKKAKHVVELNWHASERPEGWPALRLIATMQISFLVFLTVLFATAFDAFTRRSAGFSTLFPSAQAAERVQHMITADMLIAFSMPFMLAFLITLFGLWKMAAAGGASAVSFLEFAAGLPGTVVKSVAKRSFEPFHEFVEGFKDSSKQAISIAKQEQFEKNRVLWLRMVSAYFIAFYATTLGYPQLMHFFAWRLIEAFSVATIFLMEYLEYRFMRRIEEFKDEASAEQLKTVRGYMAGLRLGGGVTLAIVYLAYIVLTVVSFLDPLRGLTLLDTVILTAMTALDWITGHMVSMSILFASAILGAVAFFLAKRTVTHGENNVLGLSARSPLAMPFAIMSLIAFVCGTWGVVTTEAPLVENQLLGAGNLIPISGLNAQTRPDGKVELTWSDMTGTRGVKIQRRLETETEFKDTTAVLPVGVNNWIDQHSVLGQTVYYRLVNLNAAGETPPSEPIKVVVRIPTTPAPAPTVSSSSEPAQKKSPTAMRSKPCSGSSCGSNAALNQLCVEFPDSAGCK